MSNQECKIGPEEININSNEPLFYPYSVKINKCSGSCNNINDPFVKVCVPDVVQSINPKVFNRISRTNKTRHIKCHETCKCKCRLDSSACNNKQRWNEHKCRCECKELIDKGSCDKGFIRNPSCCKCECDKSCDVGENLDYENCKCRKKLVDKMVEECTETVEEVTLAKITSADRQNEHKCSCTIYLVLFSIIFTINIVIGTYFIYDKYMNCDKETVAKYDSIYQTTV